MHYDSMVSIISYNNNTLDVNKEVVNKDIPVLEISEGYFS